MPTKKKPAPEPEAPAVIDQAIDIPDPSVLKRKSVAKPNPLQPLVRESLERGIAKGIPFTRNDAGELLDSDGRSVKTVMAAIRTSARQLGVKVRVWDRSETQGLVGFKAMEKPEHDGEADAPEPDEEAEG